MSTHAMPPTGEHAPQNADKPLRTDLSASKLQGGGDTITGSAILGPSPSNGKTSVEPEKMPSMSLTNTSGVPQIRVDSAPGIQQPASRRGDGWLSRKSKRKTETSNDDAGFKGITLDIPSGALVDDISSENIQFSNGGSLLMDGEEVNAAQSEHKFNLTTGHTSRRIKSNPSLHARLAAKILSTDEELLSQKVRSYYEIGAELSTENDGNSSIGQSIGLRWQDALNNNETRSTSSVSRATSISDRESNVSTIGRRVGGNTEQPIEREDYELAGGLEDWKDISNEDVDRYGFILPKIAPEPDLSQGTMKRSTSMREPRPLQRVSTSLQIVSETPRRNRTLRRSPSNKKGTESPTGSPRVTRQASKRSETRPQSSQSSNLLSPTPKGRQSTLLLPKNSKRRLLNEAVDMFTLPPALEQMAEHGDVRGSAPFMRRKETEREEKWRKMARVVSKGSQGSGMVFDFDTQSPKLIERTWKGIPDRWRATAWHAFLSASAKKRKDSLSDKELIDAFHDYLAQASPDDVQIDIDVPRTVNSHIMFRRRYRGGQRLLFRVLHAMSLHFADTGYVQGMAALAATLLAYYEEEKAFVMLARMWEFRGLGKLYKSGFGGLMAALDDFEKKWLEEGELAAKLNELNIAPTAYGTRWYLTLFNYSIPFPAQLRVWDVFMLLGDEQSIHPMNGADESTQFGTTLDVLHATSAALIDGMRDILLDSDFENAMKVLTSWIPIKDEDLFMRVARVEWKMHKRKG